MTALTPGQIFSSQNSVSMLQGYTYQNWERHLTYLDKQMSLV